MDPYCLELARDLVSLLKHLWSLLTTGGLLSHARPVLAGRKTLGEERGAEGILGLVGRWITEYLTIL